MSRLLLDENVPGNVAALLRAAGHDVMLLQSHAPGIRDRDVLALATREGRCLVTFDAEFGNLVFRQGEPAPAGVVYVRLHPTESNAVAALILAALNEPVEGRFIVGTPDGLRRRSLVPVPPADSP